MSQARLPPPPPHPQLRAFMCYPLPLPAPIAPQDGASKHYVYIFADFFTKHSTTRVCIDANLCSWHTVTLTIDSQWCLGIGEGHTYGSHFGECMCKLCQCMSSTLLEIISNLFCSYIFSTVRRFSSKMFTAFTQFCSISFFQPHWAIFHCKL
jgi:hypothetical protein